jgi:hypothetical protein
MRSQAHTPPPPKKKKPFMEVAMSRRFRKEKHGL